MRENLREKLAQTAAHKQWNSIEIKDYHGINLPLSALHSERSCGIGEFLDLIPMVHWCKEVGLSIIQLLPLNDTGLGTSPYDALSANALNPIFLSMHALPGVEQIYNYKDKLSKIQYWSRTPRVKFHIVRELKNVFFKEYVPHLAPQIIETEEYQTFVKQHENWLKPYALFRTLKQVHFWKRWQAWPTILQEPTPEVLRSLEEDYAEQMQFHQILQFLCFSQMEKVKRESEGNGVYLKGDIPILISKDSVDVWCEKHLFNLELDVGAPPDVYVKEGQHWGFPLYNWEEMEKRDFHWWRARIEVSSSLYHFYRIDHIVGFFRLWGIPPTKTPSEGSFFPKEAEKWIPHGKKILSMMLESSPLLPIGEDLGIVPDMFKEEMHKLGICGTKIMRWERLWETDKSFIDPKTYDPLSMTTVSTHDSDTLKLWWRHYTQEAKDYCVFKGWSYEPFLSDERLEEILKDSHSSGSLFHINLLNEYLALYPDLVSYAPNLERINIPGKVLDTNWTYRFVPSVEDLVSNIELKERIKSLF
jgi:4-alpha-glucanotransferase